MPSVAQLGILFVGVTAFARRGTGGVVLEDVRTTTSKHLVFDPIERKDMKNVLAAILIGFAAVATCITLPARAQEERSAENKTATAPQKSAAAKKQPAAKKSKAGKSSQKSKSAGKKAKKAAPSKKAKKAKK